MRIKWLFIALGLIVLALMWKINAYRLGVDVGSQTEWIMFIFLFCCGIFAGALSLNNAQKVTRKNKDGTYSLESTASSFQLPNFLKDKTSYDYRARDRSNRLSAYREKAHDAIYGARKRDRSGRYID